MPKQDCVLLPGTIVDILPNAMFRVKINDRCDPVIGVISGRMRMHNIKVLLGDQVEIEFSPYDLTRGRIVRRK